MTLATKNCLLTAGNVEQIPVHGGRPAGLREREGEWLKVNTVELATIPIGILNQTQDGCSSRASITFP